MKKNKTIQTKKQGYILVFTLIILSIMMVMVYYSSSVLFAETAIARNQKAATIAMNLAESGVQEAVWRIKNEEGSDGAKAKFLAGDANYPIFGRDPALLSGGSYKVYIDITAPGVATITSTGLYQFGSRTAQRQIKQEAIQSNTPAAYNYEAGLFTSGSSGNGEEDMNFTNSTITVTNGGGLLSGRDMKFVNSTVTVDKDILAHRNLVNTNSTLTVCPTCLKQGGVAGTFAMPSITNLDYYKNKANLLGQSYTNQTFDDLFQHDDNVEKDGFVYVETTSGITIGNNKSLTVNGVLVVSSGSLDIGSNGNGNNVKKGILTIHPNTTTTTGEPSGVIVVKNLSLNPNSQVNITGLVYVGNDFTIYDYYNSNTSSKTVNITGGILANHFTVWERILNIHFDKSIINAALEPIVTNNPSPLIDFNHWEEKY